MGLSRYSTFDIGLLGLGVARRPLGAEDGPGWPEVRSDMLGEERHRTLAHQEVSTSTEAPQRGIPGGAVEETARLHQCTAAKGIWNTEMDGNIL